MELELLQRMGFTAGEIKVYIALLHVGSSTAGPIAKEAKVARSKLYDILDRLAKKGIVSHSIKNGTKYFSAADPSRLNDFLKKKEEDIKRQQDDLQKILPKLKLEYELKEVQQEAEVFEGLEGLKNVREDYLRNMKNKEPIYFFIVPPSALERMEGYYKDWNKRRIKQGIKSYTVMTHDSQTHQYVKDKLKHRLTYVKFLPKEFQAFSWTEVYGDTVVTAIAHKKPMSIVVHNKYVAESYKDYFKVLWKLAKDYSGPTQI